MNASRAPKSSIVFALLLILLGFLAISLPTAASISVVRVLAWLLLIAGVAQAIDALRSQDTRSVIWKLAVAVLYLGAGVYLLVQPLLGLAKLTLLLAAVLCAEGLIDIFTYLFPRGTGRSNWLLLHGAVGLVLGLMILTRWPFSSFWAIGTLVGTGMLVSGVTRLGMALEARKFARARP